MEIPTLCPLCNKKLKYSSGDGMAENSFYCGDKSHKKYEFAVESEGAYLQIYLHDAHVSIRWTYELWGEIPAKTLTIGKGFSPYDGARMNWFEPDFSDMNVLLEKFKWYLIFN